MTSQRLQLGQGFWVWWVALILLGVVMQLVLAGAIATEQWGFVGGTTVVGAVQWLIIRRRAFPSSWRVLACMGAYAVGYAAGHALLHAIAEEAVVQANLHNPAGGYVVFWAAIAFAFAVMTGIALLFLLRQSGEAIAEGGETEEGDKNSG